MKQSRSYFAPTRFADIKPWQARLIFFALVIIIVWAIFCCGKSFPPDQAHSSTSGKDADIFRSIIERVHAGQDYYKVVGSELRARGYATRPFFNFRLPLLAFFIGNLPSPEMGRWLLILLTLLTLAMWVRVLAKKGGFYMALFGALLLLGTTVSSYTDVAFLFHGMWAGVLIALSIAAYEDNRLLSVTSGLMALFIRELSLPFAVIMLIMAYKNKHPKEVAAWLIGIFAFFLYLAIHAKIVSGLVTESDVINKTWIQFGGWQFVLSTARWTLLTFFSPGWVNAILLPLALLGLWGWRGDVGTRTALTMAAYIFAFLIVGRPDNYYWGLMYAPLMPLGLIQAPPCLVDLYKAAFRIST